MLDDATIFAHLLAEKQRHEAEVFTSPPKDWADFQKRLGMWQQASASLVFLQAEAEERNQ
jgi:hypothetical protein